MKQAMILSDEINKIWRGGSREWQKDFRVKPFLDSFQSGEDVGWAFDIALRCLAAETRIADKLFSLSSAMRNDVILITTALVWRGDLCDPVTGAYYKAGDQ